MTQQLKVIFLIFLSLTITACTGMNNEDVGTIAGGVAGGILGSTVGRGDGQLVAIAAGSLAGAYFGGRIGKNMDDNDRMRMNAALENNSINEPAYWRNAKTHNTYRVTPVRNVSYHGNEYCREYRTVADIAGRKQQVYGTACRQPDGTWKIVR